MNIQDVYIHYIPKHLSDTISAYQNFVPYFTPLWKLNASLKTTDLIFKYWTSILLPIFGSGSVQFIFRITNCIEHRHHQTYTKQHQSFSVYFDTDIILLIMCTWYTKNIISISNRQLWQDLSHHRSLLERPWSL
jgi:hypothetical protein